MSFSTSVLNDTLRRIFSEAHARFLLSLKFSISLSISSITSFSRVAPDCEVRGGRRHKSLDAIFTFTKGFASVAWRCAKNCFCHPAENNASSPRRVSGSPPVVSRLKEVASTFSHASLSGAWSLFGKTLRSKSPHNFRVTLPSPINFSYHSTSLFVRIAYQPAKYCSSYSIKFGKSAVCNLGALGMCIPYHGE